MREIVSEVPNTDSVTYMFRRWFRRVGRFSAGRVRELTATQGVGGTQVVNSNTYEMARRAARNFLNNLKLPARWEGKIDGAGNILESPLKL
jgi:hypothetical protein